MFGDKQKVKIQINSYELKFDTKDLDAGECCDLVIKTVTEYKKALKGNY